MQLTFQHFCLTRNYLGSLYQCVYTDDPLQNWRIVHAATPCADNGAHLYVVLLTLSRSLPWQFSVIDLESSAPLGMLGIHFVIFWISALSLVLLSFDVLPTGILSTLDLSFRGRLSACLAAPTFPVIRDDMFFYGSLRFVPA